MKKPLAAKLRVQIDLSNGMWVELNKHTLNGNPQLSSNFNTDDYIDHDKLQQAIDILEEAIL
jgi:hypothetical protein